MDEFNRKWILANALEEIPNYEKGELTLRGLHYRLVSRGMTNTMPHYKRVLAAMKQARWEGVIEFDVFGDFERAMIGETEAEPVDLESEIESTKGTFRYWMNNYSRNKWENQPIYPEVFIEKKALQGVLGTVTGEENVALGACKGYPSLTFLHETSERLKEQYFNGKQIVLLYFGDYDPSGEDIPRSIHENLIRMWPDMEIEVRRIALMEHQVIEWDLPPAPTKEFKLGKRKDGSVGYVGDSRDKNWEGLGQVELDAVEPRQLQALCRNAINECFDLDLYQQLKEIEATEKDFYIGSIKQFVTTL